MTDVAGDILRRPEYAVRQDSCGRWRVYADGRPTSVHFGTHKEALDYVVWVKTWYPPRAEKSE